MTPATSKTLVSRVGTGVVVLLLACIFFSLGIWQLDRAAALKESLVIATTIDEKVVTLESIATTNSLLAPDAINRMVNVSGHYVTTFRAPGQVDGDGISDDWEVALLQVGTNKGVLVVRGLWSQRLLNPDISQSMQIDIQGQLRAAQSGDRTDNSQGVISRLDSAVIISATDLDLFDGYILASTEVHRGESLERTRPSAEKLRSRIPGFYWQHLSYVLIWWLMAAVVLYLPFYRRKVST